MIRLGKNELYHLDRGSSKGNQLKWKKDNIWIKADALGYEGLAEYVVSRLLEFSSLKKEEYVQYDVDLIEYDDHMFSGCVSENFLPSDNNLYTLQRLYLQIVGENLTASIFRIDNVKERIQFLVNEIERITGLNDFGIYLSKLLTLDAFFLNEDRHMHNIAVLEDNYNHYSYCPVFDNGACLLSDCRLDYPIGKDVFVLKDRAKPKTVSFSSFDEQLDAVESLYGLNLTFHFTKKDVDEILDEVPSGIYSNEYIERIRILLHSQIDKYQYLFK